MMDFDEWGEFAWIPAALLTGLLVWKWRGAFRDGLVEGRHRFGEGGGMLQKVARWSEAAMSRLRDLSLDARPSGNRSFDDHQSEVRRRLEAERRAFKAHRAGVDRAREMAEFEAFIAERDRTEQVSPAT